MITKRFIFHISTAESQHINLEKVSLKTKYIDIENYAVCFFLIYCDLLKSTAGELIS